MVSTCTTFVVRFSWILVVGLCLRCGCVVRLNCGIAVCKCTIVRCIQGIDRRKHVIDATVVTYGVLLKATSLEETVDSQQGPYLFCIGFDIAVQR